MTKGLAVQDVPVLNEETTRLLESVSFAENLFKTKGYVIKDFPLQQQPLDHPSLRDHVYYNIMKDLQCDSFKFLENNRMTTKYHFEERALASTGPTDAMQRKRLAIEASSLMASLSESTPSIFIRFDTDRLDIIKVLIIGPTGTPYANGCFEFDVFFPSDYPTSPMQLFFVTTGFDGSKVRFNHHLLSSGEVKLSVLNTDGNRKHWNRHVVLRDVLIHIQSLLRNKEPFFENSDNNAIQGTPIGRQKSKDYNALIRRATVRWAMLEQIKNPSPCFEHVCSENNLFLNFIITYLYFYQ